MIPLLFGSGKAQKRNVCKNDRWGEEDINIQPKNSSEVFSPPPQIDLKYGFRKFAKNFGIPPHLDKIQKSSNFSSGKRPLRKNVFSSHLP